MVNGGKVYYIFHNLNSKNYKLNNNIIKIIQSYCINIKYTKLKLLQELFKSTHEIRWKLDIDSKLNIDIMNLKIKNELHGRKNKYLHWYCD
jgi:hypothetical protein